MKNGYDGQVGWDLGPPKGLRRLVAADLEQARQEAIFDSDVRLKELFPDMQVVGKAKVGDRDAYVALMRTRPSAKASKYYFDDRPDCASPKNPEIRRRTDSLRRR